jgi:hypothetical protein
MQAVRNFINDPVVVQGLYLTGWVGNHQDLDLLLEIYNPAFNTAWAPRQSASDDDLGRQFMCRSRDING